VFKLAYLMTFGAEVYVYAAIASEVSSASKDY
jgi:hypothetical protein